MFRRAEELVPIEDRLGQLRRWTASLYGDVQELSKAWVEFKAKKNPESRNATFDFLRSTAVDLKMLAKAFDMNLAPFNICISVLENLQIRVQTGDVGANLFNPTVFGKVTLLLRDVRGAAKELLSDVRGMQKVDAYSVSAYGADLGMIVSSMVLLARVFKLNAAPFGRVRDTVYEYFRIMSDEAMASVAEQPTEATEEAMRLASRIRKASILAKSDPDRAVLWLDALCRSLEA